MKWLGQYIQDLTARFRNDVYLENISSGTIASGGNLGLDSNNKIVKATEASGDITGVSITTDSGSGSKAEDTGGSADFSILGTSGVGVTNSGATITVTSVPGEIDHDSLLNFAVNEHFTQANITTVGTITTGTWQSTAIASAYLDTDTAHLSGAQTFTGAKTFNEITSAIFDGDKDVNPGDGAVIHIDSHEVRDTTTSASGTAAMFTHVNIEAPRLLATNASVTTTDAATLYINNAPTAGTNQTLTNQYALWVDAGLVKFDGALTVGGTITGDVTGDITGDVTGNADTATTAGIVTTAAQPNIESIGTDGDTLSVLSDFLTMTNSTSTSPMIQLTNTTDDAFGPRIILINQRGGSAGADADDVGEIYFQGYDDQGTPASQIYGKVLGEIHDATSGEESGKLSLQVANHDGGLGSGLVLTGGSENDEVDATIGLGSNSVVTIPGGLSLGTDLPTDQQKHLMHYRFMGYSTGDGTNYEMGQQMTDGQAPFEHADTSSSDGLTIPGASGTNVSEMIRMGGYVMPNAATLKKWTGWVSYNDNGNDCYIALFKWSPVENDTTDISASHGGLTLLDEATVAGKANDKVMPLSETTFTSASVAAGDIIFTQVKTSTSGKIVYFNTTLEVEF